MRQTYLLWHLRDHCGREEIDTCAVARAEMAVVQLFTRTPEVVKHGMARREKMCAGCLVVVFGFRCLTVLAARCLKHGQKSSFLFTASWNRLMSTKTNNLDNEAIPIAHDVTTGP